MSCFSLAPTARWCGLVESLESNGLRGKAKAFNKPDGRTDLPCRFAMKEDFRIELWQSPIRICQTKKADVILHCLRNNTNYVFFIPRWLLQQLTVWTRNVLKMQKDDISFPTKKGAKSTFPVS